MGITLEKRVCKCGCGVTWKSFPNSKQEYASLRCTAKDTKNLIYRGFGKWTDATTGQGVTCLGGNIKALKAGGF